MKMYSVLICLVVVTAVAGTTYKPYHETTTSVMVEDNTGMSCYYCSGEIGLSDCGLPQNPYDSSTTQCDGGNGCMVQTYWDDYDMKTKVMRDCAYDGCWSGCNGPRMDDCTTCCYGNNCNEKHAEDRPIMAFAPSTGPTMMVTMTMSLIAFFML
ncbi:uncharacterized protein LOC144447607 isoform X1 [Glandiceps talaboti]